MSDMGIFHQLSSTLLIQFGGREQMLVKIQPPT